MRGEPEVVHVVAARERTDAEENEILAAAGEKGARRGGQVLGSPARRTSARGKAMLVFSGITSTGTISRMAETRTSKSSRTTGARHWKCESSDQRPHTYLWPRLATVRPHSGQGQSGSSRRFISTSVRIRISHLRTRARIISGRTLLTPQEYRPIIFTTPHSTHGD